MTTEKQREYAATYRRAHPDRVKASNEAYRKASADKRSATHRAWAKANPEKVNALMAAWRKANPTKDRAIGATYRKKNAQQIRARKAAYKKANPDICVAASMRRRTKKLAAPGNGVTAAQWRNCLAESLGLCAYCNERKRLTMDHIEPLTLGGAHDVENIAAACSTCNPSKGDRPLLVWLAQRRVA